MNRLRERVACLSLLLLIVACRDQRSTASASRLALIEACSLRLDSAFIPAGVTIASDGSLALWAFQSRRIAVLSPTDSLSWHLRPAGFEPLAIRLIPIGESWPFQAIDAAKKFVWGWGDDRTPSRMRSDDTREWLGAVTAGEHWLLAVRDSLGLRLTLLGESPSAEVPNSIGVTGFGRDRVSISLASSPSGVVVATRRPPFRVAELDTATRVLSYFSLQSPQIPGGDHQPRWTGGAILSIRGGYLRTYSDLRSDWRAIVQYDASFGRSATTYVRAPMSLLAADTVRERVLGILDVGLPELVRYRMEYTGQPSVPSTTPCGSRRTLLES